MTGHQKLLEKILGGNSDANIPFRKLCGLLIELGFEERVRGSHHVFTKLNVDEFVNLQEDGGKAKVYQVRQVRTDPEIRLGTSMKAHRYEVIIYWSREDNAFVADVPELPGCMAHGSTHEGALREVKRAMDLWIETAQEKGRPIPEPKGRRLLFA